MTKSIKDLIATRQKLLPEWSAESQEFFEELYSRLEYAETELEVFNLRINKQWTKGSNLYNQKEVDALVEAEYSIGHDHGWDACSSQSKKRLDDATNEAYNAGYRDGKENFYGE